MTQSTAITQASIGADIERVLIDGDLSRLSPEQRVRVYNHTCSSLGLNPLTKPFMYVVLNGKMQLYARKDCTDQLRGLHKIAIAITDRRIDDDIYIVTARATMPDGRQDEDVGAVPIGSLKGEARANAMMKAHTKAKRRATLSVVGLGVLDESELDSVAGARRVDVTADGEVVQSGPSSTGGGVTFATFAQDIEDAQTIGALRAVGEAIKGANGTIGRDLKVRLTELYSARLSQLKVLAEAEHTQEAPRE